MSRVRVVCGACKHPQDLTNESCVRCGHRIGQETVLCPDCQMAVIPSLMDRHRQKHHHLDPFQLERIAVLLEEIAPDGWDLVPVVTPLHSMMSTAKTPASRTLAITIQGGRHQDHEVLAVALQVILHKLPSLAKYVRETHETVGTDPGSIGPTEGEALGRGD